MIPVNSIICGAMPQATKVFPDGYFNCCISSPPYWALRDYGVEGQLGLEKTFEEYIDKLCTIYDEVKRVLRDDGTCWVNLGDTYGNSGKGISGGYSNKSTLAGYTGEHTKGRQMAKENWHFSKRPGVKDQHLAKSLCLIPQRFAIEMVNRGWILRNVIIWHKPNPMPSSAKDRFTVDFEYVYFFVKSNRNLWYFRPDGKVSDKQPDFKKGSEGLDWQWGMRKGRKVKTSLWQGFKYWFEPQYEPQSETSHPRYARGLTEPPPADPNSKELNRPGYENWREKTPTHILPLGRNKRTVWTISTQSFPDAHFATFPEKLVEPMIKAGCPEFVCTKCGKAREKIWDKEFLQTGAKRNNITGQDNMQGWEGIPRGNQNHYFKGYTDCGCNTEWRPGIVLDCFLWVWDDFTGSRQAAA